jgi:hypothetical protein
MGWKVVTLTNDSDGLAKAVKLQDSFEHLFISDLAPMNSRMYGSRSIVDGNNFWFSPGAVAIAGLLLESFGAKECEAPDIQNLTFLVGNASVEGIY